MRPHQDALASLGNVLGSGLEFLDIGIALLQHNSVSQDEDVEV